MKERSAENRQRIANDVVDALRSTSLTPEEKTLIEMVARGQRSSVVVGVEVVEALFRHKMLLTAVSTAEDLNAPGWRHVEKRVYIPPHPWIKPTTEREWRVTGYHLTEAGFTYMYDLGGWLNLDAVTDYTRWEFRWNPTRPWFDTKLQPLKASPPPSTERTKPQIIPRATATSKPSSLRVSPKLQQPETLTPEPLLLMEGEIFHTKTNMRGKLLKDEAGKPLRDDEGRLLAEFPGPPVLRARIPEGLIGTTYQIGILTPADKTE